uniref:Uncharacterized protein n=1 Tax=Poecilia mexicana TaxID=48701 RepID=A0A3B3YE52_9TELE
GRSKKKLRAAWDHSKNGDVKKKLYNWTNNPGEDLVFFYPFILPLFIYQLE